jgi:predicted TIM-barrel fold metal-dependent hydrolase
MIIDGHVHIWNRWPYQPAVPDPDSRARAEQLLWQMDAAGVERALVICAAIGENAHNTADAFDAAERHPGRLEVFADVECRWSPAYGSPGAAARLAAALARWPLRGIAHYLTEAEDGAWLTGPEGEAFFALAAGRRLIVSLSAMPHQMGQVLALARRHPDLVLVLNHHGFLGPRRGATADARALVTATAAAPNVHVKLSGMGHLAAPTDEYPYQRLNWIVQAMLRAFGPRRLIWGSDWPVSARAMTYPQTLSWLTRHGGLDPATQAATLGGTLARLLEAAGPEAARAAAAAAASAPAPAAAPALASAPAPAAVAAPAAQPAPPARPTLAPELAARIALRLGEGTASPAPGPDPALRPVPPAARPEGAKG